MNLVYLKYLCEVEKYGSLSKAATHLYINQPRLSKIVKDIEKENNLVIFKRTNKGMVPTKKGILFLEQVKKIMHEVDDLKTMSHETSQTMSLDMSVPRVSYISKAFVQYLHKYQNHKHYMDMNYRETNSLSTIQHVFEGEDDLGIIRLPIEDKEYFLNVLALKDLSYQDLFSFQYQLLMSKESSIANQAIYQADLVEKIELAHGDVMLSDHPLSYTNKLRKKGLSSRVVHIYERGSQFEILSQMKDTYMWVSPMPKETLERFGLIQKACQDMNVTCIDLLIYRKGYHMTEESHAFIQELQAVIQEL